MISKRGLLSLFAALPIARLTPAPSRFSGHTTYFGPSFLPKNWRYAVRAANIDTVAAKTVLEVRDYAGAPQVFFRGIPIKVRDAISPSTEEAA